MTTDNDQPNFCSDCGALLVKPDAWCTSRMCSQCGKEIFLMRRGEDGGLKVEKGEQIHLPQLTFSLNPKDDGVFSRIGLESFLKHLFLGVKIESEEKLIDAYKNTEHAIDKELNNLDCISHCDLNTAADVGEARKILESDGMYEYMYNLMRSASLRECYTSVENGDALRAAYYSHLASVFKEYSLLENYHLKEIIWLGYQCYVDLSKNKELTPQTARELRLLKTAQNKIKNLETSFIYAVLNDDKDVAPRIGLSGISEDTLSAMLQHEIDLREKDREDELRQQEMDLKIKDQRIKLWGFFFTLANGIILALYKDWLG